MSKATAELESGAAPNMEANKKLVGLAQKSVKLGKVASPVSFVQIVQHQQSGKQAAVQKVRSFLDSMAEQIGRASCRERV